MLLGTGSRRLLIDAGQGMASWTEAVQRVLKDENAAIEKCLLTHWHPDHSLGVTDLLEFSPDTVVHKNEPGDHEQGIADGQVFSVQGATLVAVHTPGHTTDHVSFVLQEEDALFTGDCVLGQGTTVFEDLSVYMRTLKRMGELFSGRAYPGHGPVITDGPAKILEYQTHRKQREDQVLRVMQSPRQGENLGRGWASMDLVKIIYNDVQIDLHEAAEKGVVLILHKLEKDAKVTQGSDGLWKTTGRPSL